MASPIHKVSSARRLGNEINLAPRGLVVLVQFKDLKFKTYNKQAEFDSLMNGTNYTKYGAMGSVRKYFTDQSNGAYSPQFDVTPIVTLSRNYSYYGANGRFGDGGDAMIGDFVIDAMNAVAKLGSVDFSLYDNDDDGEVDFVYFIYAGTNEAISDDAYTIWPKNFSLEGAIQYGMTSYTQYSYNWRTGQVTMPEFGGKKVNNFACSSELDTRNIRTGIGTICHEFSHVIGLPDYYDTQYGENYQNGLTPGRWSLMDGGSYNNDGRTPPNYSIYDKYFLGWITPKILNAADDITLTTAYNAGYQINSNGKQASARTTAQQYYIENRQQTGWDTYLPGHGMIVWSVRYSSSDWESNIVNNTASAPRYTVSPAEMDSMIGTDKDSYPGASEVRNYTPIVQYPLTEITELENGNISFKFMGGKKGDALDETEADNRSAHKIMRDGQVVIIRNQQEFNVLGKQL